MYKKKVWKISDCFINGSSLNSDTGICCTDSQ